MYFNLKDGVSEAEFVNKLKEYFDYLNGKVEGLGSSTLYIDIMPLVRIRGRIKCMRSFKPSVHGIGM
jgi:hypothetical protein